MRRALLLACAALLALALACSDDEEAAPEAEATPDPAVLLDEAAQATADAESFHFLLDHDNGRTEIVRGLGMERAEGDIVGADEMQATIVARAGPLAVDVSIVILPNEAWITNPLTGRWEREDISIDAIFDPQEGVPALVSAVNEPALVGTEQVDGVETYRLEATVDSGDLAALVPNAEPGIDVPAVIWIGVEDQLVRRIELRGPVTPAEEESIVRRLELSQFGQDVEITAPR